MGRIKKDMLQLSYLIDVTYHLVLLSFIFVLNKLSMRMIMTSRKMYKLYVSLWFKVIYRKYYKAV